MDSEPKGAQSSVAQEEKGRAVEQTVQGITQQAREVEESEKLAETPEAVIQGEDPSPEKEERLCDMTIDQVLKVSTSSIDFGELYPGQISEETVIIQNNMTSVKVPFKIKVNCLSKEFDELDEYVYSMRRPSVHDAYNYNDTFLILLAPKAVSFYKLAIKVPNIREEKDIFGSIEITSEECADSIVTVPIRSRIVMPTIRCEKMIVMKNSSIPVIKLFMKVFPRQEFRISLKNMNKTACGLELMLLFNESKQELVDVTLFPPTLILSPGMPVNFALALKALAPSSDLAGQEYRCIVVAKIKTGTPIFAYPVSVIFGDGKNAGSSFAS